MRLFRRNQAVPGPSDEALRLAAARGRVLVEESREILIVLDEEQRVVAASRRAREVLDGVEQGSVLPEEILRGQPGREPVTVSYEVDGRRELLLYLSEPGELAAYEELRAGFTAAVSHELRTPLARLLALLETAQLSASYPDELFEQARAEVEQIRELIDEVLFLSELETGRAVVSLGSTAPQAVLEDVVGRLEERAVRAGVTLRLAVDDNVRIPLRPRMLRMVAANLAENAIRYAGPGTTFTLATRSESGDVVLSASDDGAGVDRDELGRLFERFYRTDRARASRGTGLGLAIVKHVVTSAGGSVEASGARGEGLTVRCRFPAA
jgi:two-component system, OmpR family, phosphate regulon sensor histidine kinase PhoR